MPRSLEMSVEIVEELFWPSQSHAMVIGAVLLAEARNPHHPVDRSNRMHQVAELGRIGDLQFEQ